MRDFNVVISYLFILLASACVDRINFNAELATNFPVVIDGNITDSPGPVIIKVSKAFDIDSNDTQRKPASVQEMILKDNAGNEEKLMETSPGEYQSSNDFTGIPGRAYSLRVKVNNGAIFESVADTLYESGTMDTVYARLVNTGELEIETDQSKYAFDIYFSGSRGGSNSPYFLWKFKGTFKVTTVPEYDQEGEPCGPPDCSGCSVCNRVWKCSGLRNKGTVSDPVYVRFEPCSCCDCWYTIHNDRPMINDWQFLNRGVIEDTKIGTIPVHKWIFQQKIHAEVSQYSISRQTYDFYKSIRDQADGINSLFQPVSGKIRSNFIQQEGPETSIEGFFYAAGKRSKHVILTRGDVPGKAYVFPEDQPVPKNCKNLYPNSTTIKPGYWED
jgi:hypothetical protein